MKRDIRAVFVNAPFDPAYAPLFEALVFTIQASGYKVRCALEENDSGDIRRDQLARLIGESPRLIHDLSRIERGVAELPRFNMPFELGMAMGAKRFSLAAETTASRSWSASPTGYRPTCRTSRQRSGRAPRQASQRHRHRARLPAQVAARAPVAGSHQVRQRLPGVPGRASRHRPRHQAQGRRDRRYHELPHLHLLRRRIPAPCRSVGRRLQARTSVQLSENASAEVLKGLPSRTRFQGRPEAATPFRVRRAPSAGTSTVQTP